MHYFFKRVKFANTVMLSKVLVLHIENWNTFFSRNKIKVVPTDVLDLKCNQLMLFSLLHCRTAYNYLLNKSQNSDFNMLGNRAFLKSH